MHKDRQAVREQLCSAIATTLQRSGRKLPEFKDSDKPLEDYDGLDSQCGIEVTVELETALGVDDLGNNIFVKGTGKAARATTLSEIITSILPMIPTQKGRKA